MKSKLINATMMFEKRQVLDEDNNVIMDKTGKPKVIRVGIAVRDNGWFLLSEQFKNH